MAIPNVLEDLRASAAAEDFAVRCNGLVDQWTAAGVGMESVEPVLRFMEEHSEIDFGMPGALVHFVERFYGPAYESLVVESIRRRPTPHTAWMLNRLINGAKTAERRSRFLAVMNEARLHPSADPETPAELADFLDWQRRSD